MPVATFFIFHPDARLAISLGTRFCEFLSRIHLNGTSAQLDFVSSATCASLAVLPPLSAK